MITPMPATMEKATLCYHLVRHRWTPSPLEEATIYSCTLTSFSNEQVNLTCFVMVSKHVINDRESFLVLLVFASKEHATLDTLVSLKGNEVCF